jgi:8-oxo-dGTP pyrophosphatase MutT (NUDIX family)
MAVSLGRSFNEAWLSQIECAAKAYGEIPITEMVDVSKIDTSKRRRAAVLVPLCNRDGEAAILYTLRSNKVKTHKGHVSFPGGHVEASDADMIATALRETHEELGIRPNNVKILGVCQTVIAMTGTLVTPVLGFVDQDLGNLQMLDLCDDEVDHAFTRSISELVACERFENLSRASGEAADFPCYGDEGDPERIWGLTALLTGSLLRNMVLQHDPSTDESAVSTQC